MNTDASYSFGQWMKRQRKALSLTQRELAQQVHCSVITIKKIEADHRRPSRELAHLLANALAIPEDHLTIFVECARGQRPVDHLGWEISAGITDARIPFVRPVSPLPLPVATTPLIGREAELAMLQSLLAKRWLVTIVGIGGIGKTRLALAAAAEQQREGKITVFVPLAELTAEDDMSAAIVEALGLQLTPDSNPTSQLLTYLRQKTLLIVLDNFEHLLANGSLLNQVHQAAPTVTLLVTSREPLRLPGEQLLPLESLAYPDDGLEEPTISKTGEIGQYAAIQLFLDHARRLLPGFTADREDELRQLGNITCGLPLAIELAAAWVDRMTLPDLMKTLVGNIDLLTLEQPDRPARHHSVRAAFDTSWQFLDQTEREAFIRLSIFQGGFTRQAAEEIAGISLPTLLNLVGRYLVRLDHENGRYSLHELMRQYGAEKLSAVSQNETEIRGRHAQFFCEFLANSEADLKNANQRATMAEIRADRANIWAAWRWAAHHPDEVLLADAIAPLGNAFLLGGWIEDGYNLFSRASSALADYQDRPGVLLSFLHLNVWRCWLVYWLGRPTDVLLDDIQQRLEEVPVSASQRSVSALCHLVAEEILLDTGEREAALSHGEQALALYRDLGDSWGQANALSQLGTVRWNVGAYAEAQRYFEESLALRRQIGDRLGEAISLDRLGLLAMHQGQLESSNHYLEQAVGLFGELGARSRLADALENMGSNWLEMGKLADARRQYAETAALFDELGLQHTGVTVLLALNVFACANMGAYERAEQEAKTAVARSREFGHTRSEGLALIILGMAFLARGDDAAAAVHLSAGTNHLQAIGQLEELAQGIGVQALVAYRQGDFEQARQNVSAALAILNELHGLASSPNYALAAWAMLLAEQGDYERAAEVYRLVLAEPLGAASRWFVDMCGRFVAHSPPAGFMPLEERWEKIAQLSRTV